MAMMSMFFFLTQFLPAGSESLRRTGNRVRVPSDGRRAVHHDHADPEAAPPFRPQAAWITGIAQMIGRLAWGRKAVESGVSPQRALVSGMTEAFVAATILAVFTFGIALTFRRQER
jgi:hypothetical protein